MPANDRPFELVAFGLERHIFSDFIMRVPTFRL